MRLSSSTPHPCLARISNLDCPRGARGYADPFSENYLPDLIGQGSVHDISPDSDDRGFYLPNGTWRPLPRRRIGF